MNEPLCSHDDQEQTHLNDAELHDHHREVIQGKPAWSSVTCSEKGQLA